MNTGFVKESAGLLFWNPYYAIKLVDVIIQSNCKIANLGANLGRLLFVCHHVKKRVFYQSSPLFSQLFHISLQLILSQLNLNKIRGNSAWISASITLSSTLWYVFLPYWKTIHLSSFSTMKIRYASWPLMADEIEKYGSLRSTIFSYTT